LGLQDLPLLNGQHHSKSQIHLGSGFEKLASGGGQLIDGIIGLLLVDGFFVEDRFEIGFGFIDGSALVPELVAVFGNRRTDLGVLRIRQIEAFGSGTFPPRETLLLRIQCGRHTQSR